jgi:hypothetical protein
MVDKLSPLLWDLRAQAESKLRCLTRVQQLLAVYERSDTQGRKKKRDEILKDLTDVVTISKALRSLSEEALAAARKLS